MAKEDEKDEKEENPKGQYVHKCTINGLLSLLYIYKEDCKII